MPNALSITVFSPTSQVEVLLLVVLGQVPRALYRSAATDQRCRRFD